MGSGQTVTRAACESTYEDEVGEPPKERLEQVAAAGRAGCAELSPAGWRDAQASAVRALMAAHGDLAPPRKRPDLSAIVRSSVDVSADVYCWRPGAWVPFSEHDAILRGGEEATLRGVADARRNRIDLDPGICRALGRYLRRERPSPLTYQNYELAEALSVLTHEAEHLKAQSATENAVECYATQHVRPLVRNVWGPRFANEIALHAWEIGYLPLPAVFRAAGCRDGGPLDRNPTSKAWP